MTNDKIICKACGVELDDGMDVCPLCETSVSSNGNGERSVLYTRTKERTAVKKKHVLQQILWQITSVLLLSGIIATLIIDISIKGKVTWSIYPMLICLIIFSYASLMALWHTKMVFQILTGWAISSVVLIGVSWYITSAWPLELALPILCAINIMGLILYFILRNVKTKGLNILAIMFVGVAVLCLTIEGIISLYIENVLRLQWSVIVAACLLPVTAAILFMYFRTRNNTDLQKIFHT